MANQQRIVVSNEGMQWPANDEHGNHVEVSKMTAIARNISDELFTETIKIYTDWANYYLSKDRGNDRRSRVGGRGSAGEGGDVTTIDDTCAMTTRAPLIVDLQKDLIDGVVLADVIEAVTNEHVMYINRTASNSSQMVENIEKCLACLVNLGPSFNLDGLSAQDIHEGKLQSILLLFFNLSRLKQQLKAAAVQYRQEQELRKRSSSTTRRPRTSRRRHQLLELASRNHSSSPSREFFNANNQYALSGLDADEGLFARQEVVEHSLDSQNGNMLSRLPKRSGHGDGRLHTGLSSFLSPASDSNTTTSSPAYSLSSSNTTGTVPPQYTTMSDEDLANANDSEGTTVQNRSNGSCGGTSAGGVQKASRLQPPIGRPGSSTTRTRGVATKTNDRGVGSKLCPPSIPQLISNDSVQAPAVANRSGTYKILPEKRGLPRGAGLHRSKDVINNNVVSLSDPALQGRGTGSGRPAERDFSSPASSCSSVPTSRTASTSSINSVASAASAAAGVPGVGSGKGKSSAGGEGCKSPGTRRPASKLSMPSAQRSRIGKPSNSGALSATDNAVGLKLDSAALGLCDIKSDVAVGLLAEQANSSAGTRSELVNKTTRPVEETLANSENLILLHNSNEIAHCGELMERSDIVNSLDHNYSVPGKDQESLHRSNSSQVTEMVSQESCGASVKGCFVDNGVDIKVSQTGSFVADGGLNRALNITSLDDHENVLDITATDEMAISSDITLAGVNDSAALETNGESHDLDVRSDTDLSEKNLSQRLELLDCIPATKIKADAKIDDFHSPDLTFVTSSSPSAKASRSCGDCYTVIAPPVPVRRDSQKPSSVSDLRTRSADHIPCSSSADRVSQARKNKIGKSLSTPGDGVTSGLTDSNALITQLENEGLAESGTNAFEIEPMSPISNMSQYAYTSGIYQNVQHQNGTQSSGVARAYSTRSCGVTNSEDNSAMSMTSPQTSFVGHSGATRPSQLWHRPIIEPNRLFVGRIRGSIAEESDCGMDLDANRKVVEGEHRSDADGHQPRFLNSGNQARVKSCLSGGENNNRGLSIASRYMHRNEASHEPNEDINHESRIQQHGSVEQSTGVHASLDGKRNGGNTAMKPVAGHCSVHLYSESPHSHTASNSLKSEKRSGRNMTTFLEDSNGRSNRAEQKIPCGLSDQTWQKYCIENEASNRSEGLLHSPARRATLPKARKDENLASTALQVKNAANACAIDEFQASCDLALESYAGGNEDCAGDSHIDCFMEDFEQRPSNNCHIVSSKNGNGRNGKQSVIAHHGSRKRSNGYLRSDLKSPDTDGVPPTLIASRNNGCAKIPEMPESPDIHSASPHGISKLLPTSPPERPQGFGRSLSAYRSQERAQASLRGSGLGSAPSNGRGTGAEKENLNFSSPGLLKNIDSGDSNRRFVHAANNGYQARSSANPGHRDTFTGNTDIESQSSPSCVSPTSPSARSLGIFRYSSASTPDRRMHRMEPIKSASSMLQVKSSRGYRNDRQGSNPADEEFPKTNSAGSDGQQCNSLPRFVGRHNQSSMMTSSGPVDSVVGVAALNSSFSANNSTNSRGTRSSGDWPVKSTRMSGGDVRHSGEAIVGTPRRLTSKDDETHGSLLSLISNVSSVYSTAEEKQAQEVRKLRRELDLAQEKIGTLTTQLTTNVHVVTAFEQSLASMTHRLQKLSAASEQKDSELCELRSTLQSLKSQSRSQFHSQPDAIITPNSSSALLPVLRRQASLATSPLNVTNANGHNVEKINAGNKGVHLSMDNVSIVTNGSGISLGSLLLHQHQRGASLDKKHKKINWFKSSITKAFGRRKTKTWSEADAELRSSACAGIEGTTSVPGSPLLHSPARILSMPNTPSLNASRNVVITAGQDMPQTVPGIEVVLELQQQLHDKDMKLTDIRLEALSSAHHLESLRDSMNRMKSEIAALKSENERMQQLISEKGLDRPQSGSEDSATSSAACLSHPPPVSRISLGGPTRFDAIAVEALYKNGQRFTVSVKLGPFSRVGSGEPSSVLIGTISVTNKTSWEALDSIVRKLFKEHISRLENNTSMGLGSSSILNYSMGEIVRIKGSAAPELLPCGYLVGDNTGVVITLKDHQQNCADSLAFETLVPKSIIQRYISLVLEHRRLILCGPSGTGKTYLAQKLAEYLVLSSGKEPTTTAVGTAGLIATFNVDQKSGRELRQYLANIADQCEHSSIDLPAVILLDNLHHVASIGEAFNPLLGLKYQVSPYIIGTMNQTAPNATNNLQLHHNFRWVLCTNHVEPVRGFLARYLQRRIVEEEVTGGGLKNDDLTTIVEWLPRVWQHIGRFLETYCSAEISIGPRLFLSCPMDLAGSQVWFTDLWNYSIIPYILEAVREGIQVYGQRAPWENPTDWVIENYPWRDAPKSNKNWPSLLHLRAEDVGYDTQAMVTLNSGISNTTDVGSSREPMQVSINDSEKNEACGSAPGGVGRDPLMTMLLRLQEAASYSSAQSNESDSASLDSHSGSTEQLTNINKKTMGVSSGP